MAHYVFYRQDTDGDGYPEYIADIVRMTITEDPWMAQQYDDNDLRRIDVPFMGRYGFFPVGIVQLGLRIQPHLAYHPPLEGLFRLLTPPAYRRRTPVAPRPAPMAPRPHVPPRGVAMSGPAAHRPAPVAPRPAPGPAPAPRPAAPRPAGPGMGPGPHGGRGPMGGPGRR